VSRPDEPVGRFRARRRMKADGLGKHAWMDVWTELSPEDGFCWTVESEGGSGLLLDKGLRSMLRREEESYNSGRIARAALTAENYDLAPAGRDLEGLVHLRARPRRRDSTLLDGTFVVTADTADLVRAGGRLAKGPSFWIPRVDVVRHYARLRGHRVLVRVETVAHVRFLGESRLVVTYDYEMVNGEELSPSSPSNSPTTRGAEAGAGAPGR